MSKLSGPGRKGFTIAETLVAFGLLVILMGAIYALVSLAFRHAREAEVFETVHQQALLGIQRISKEIEVTSKSSATVIGADYIIFASPHRVLGTPNHETYTHDSNGNLEWYKWVALYLEPSTGIIYRSEIALVAKSPSPPLASTQPPISDFKAITDGRRTIISRNCSALQFGQGLLVPQTIRVELETRKNVNSDQQTTVTLEAEILPKNEP